MAEKDDMTVINNELTIIRLFWFIQTVICPDMSIRHGRRRSRHAPPSSEPHSWPFSSIITLGNRVGSVDLSGA